MIEPASAQDLFKGRHFDRDIIILCVRWYLTFKLSARDLVQMMTERGIVLAHTTMESISNRGLKGAEALASGYWSFQNLSDHYVFTIKVMGYLSCVPPGWEDVTGQCVGGDALSCH